MTFPRSKGEVFVVGDLAELVAEAVGGADGLVDVAVGVAVYPVVDAAGGHLQDSLVGVARCEVVVRSMSGICDVIIRLPSCVFKTTDIMNRL